jgi:hypothetical protein
MKNIAEHIKPFIDQDFGATPLKEIVRVLYMDYPAVSLREKAVIEMLVETWWQT